MMKESTNKMSAKTLSPEERKPWAGKISRPETGALIAQSISFITLISEDQIARIPRVLSSSQRHLIEK